MSLVDCGIGNLHSIRKALENAGGVVDIIHNINDLKNSRSIVFPGVGAFDRTMEKLSPHIGNINEILSSGVPTLCICIGMQILFEKSDEGNSEGLGFIKGDVKHLKAKQTPHMGWNSVDSEDELLDGVENRYFYFAHSYCGHPIDKNITKGTTEYHQTIPVLFKKKNVYGCQFHPEKSSVSGNIVIKNFIDFAEANK